MTPPVAPPTPRRLPKDLGRLLRVLSLDDGWRRAAPLLPAASRDPQLLLHAAVHHRLGGPLHLTVQGAAPAARRCVPDRVVAELAVGHGTAVAHHMRALATLRDVTRLLEGAGVRSAVLKGPALAALCYPRPDLRWYRDLDLLVAGADVGTAVETLEAAGSTLLDRNWDLINEVRPGELHVLTPQGVVLDLHFELVNNLERRSRFRVDPAAVLRRAEQVTLSGYPVVTSDPTDTVLHLALHTALSGADRLGWFADIDQTVRRRPPAWSELVSRAQGWGIATLVHQVLLRASTSLQTPVPRSTLEELSPGATWTAAVAFVHHVDNLSRTTGRASPARALARQAHPGAGQTLRAALAGASARGPRFTGDDPANPQSVLHDSGGDAGRRRFFGTLR